MKSLESGMGEGQAGLGDSPVDAPSPTRSGRIARKYIKRARGIPFRRHSLIDGGFTSKNRAAATVPPSLSMMVFASMAPIVGMPKIASQGTPNLRNVGLPNMATALADRIRKAMADKEGCTLSSLATAAGVKPPSVSDWLNGKTKTLKAATAHRAAAYLGVTFLWLTEGRGPMRNSSHIFEPQVATLPPLSNVSIAPPDVRRIPVISYVQAGNPSEAIDAYATGSGMEDIFTDIELGPYAFALVIQGDSMAPEFGEGDKIIIDPAVRPRPGEFVVAKCNGDEVTFKKYRPRGVSASGHEVFELVPLNPDYASINSEITPTQIIGTMIEHRKYRRGTGTISSAAAADSPIAYRKAAYQDGATEGQPERKPRAK